MDYGIQVKSPKTKFFNLRKIAQGKKKLKKRILIKKHLYNRHDDY